MFGLGVESVPILRLAQPSLPHSQVFEVCYLDGELSHAWQEGREAVWSGKEQSRGAEGPSLNLQLTHGTSHARHFTIQSRWKMRIRPKSGSH